MGCCQYPNLNQLIEQHLGKLPIIYLWFFFPFLLFQQSPRWIYSCDLVERIRRACSVPFSNQSWPLESIRLISTPRSYLSWFPQYLWVISRSLLTSSDPGNLANIPKSYLDLVVLFLMSTSWLEVNFLCDLLHRGSPL